MTNPLFERAAPQGLARAGQVIECKEELRHFARLTAAVEADLAGVPEAQRPAAWRQAMVSIRLRFGFADAAGQVPALVGELGATVTAVCQRCLECFELPLAAELGHVLAAPDEPAAEPAGYDTWELGEPAFRPVDLVDEALLMAWPLAAAHASVADCGPLAQKLATDAPETVRPFAGLKAQLERSDSK
ncbi:MAG: YceD family protein [Gammaproteobacteria bacterium]|nr:YceD family protein [Gammaproteobacteria bacterium]MDH4256181.1 YceD family protein [Gammaproteobacteria bacterium]MDH5311162.1 YceD family protein [Gammaproteobacteria bacterium]